ncbi:hypothetical protein CN479_26830 [Bacillus thuringiensis]|nr:hypothetical protein CN479_26830 [Bacillus thuringiensis]
MFFARGPRPCNLIASKNNNGHQNITKTVIARVNYKFIFYKNVIRFNFDNKDYKINFFLCYDEIN